MSELNTSIGTKIKVLIASNITVRPCEPIVTAWAELFMSGYGNVSCPIAEIFRCDGKWIACIHKNSFGFDERQTSFVRFDHAMCQMKNWLGIGNPVIPATPPDLKDDVTIEYELAVAAMKDLEKSLDLAMKGRAE